MLIYFLSLIFLIFPFASCKYFSWIPDSIYLNSSYVRSSPKKSNFKLNVLSNGPIYSETSGNIQIQVSFYSSSRNILSSLSECIDLTSNSNQLNNFLSNSTITPYNGNSFSGVLREYFRITSRKYLNNLNSSHIIAVYDFVFESLSNNSIISISFTTQSCLKIRTYGYWDDPKRWNLQSIPTSNSSVLFPQGSGVIYLFSNVTLNSLTMNDGKIIAYLSGCPKEWTIDDRNAFSEKAYKIFDEVLPFSKAENYCNTLSWKGSKDLHLVRINDEPELSLMKRLCRGDDQISSRQLGCWIGLQDSVGYGNFEWIDKSKKNLYFDWRRGEPNNHTISMGLETLGGERCASLLPSSNDPLLFEQGSWKDDSCQTFRPFICQVFCTTTKFSITLNGNADFTNGTLEGGILILLGNQNKIFNFIVSRTGTISLLGPQNQITNLTNLILLDASKFILATTIWITDNSFLGENFLSKSYHSQSQFLATNNSLINIFCVGTCSSESNFFVNSSVQFQGSIKVSDNMNIELSQGGVISQSKVHLYSKNSCLTLSGYASKLFTYDSFDLIVQNRGKFLGEYYGKNTSAEISNKYTLKSIGVYRLTVSETKNRINTTKCIPYNSSSEELASILNELPIISNRRNVTVRRFGDGTSAYNYGYQYRIEVDSADISFYGQGPLTFAISCEGLSCGCAQTKVSSIDDTGTRVCPIHSNFSFVDPDSCVISPSILLIRKTYFSQTNFTGIGHLTISGGIHRLPPILNIPLIINHGIGITASDKITWKSLFMLSNGTLRLTGMGWVGWDSQDLLFSPSWTDRRGLVSYLQNSPQFSMKCSFFYLTGNSSFYSTSPNSNISFNSGIWSGGSIGGLSNIYLLSNLILNGTTKNLKYGVNFLVTSSGQVDWLQGNITLSNGANFTVDGILFINNNGSESTSISDIDYLSSDQVTESPGRNWQSYYDSRMDAELRPGWYKNEICGEKCLQGSFVTISGNGAIHTSQLSSINFFLPLNVTGNSRFFIGQSSIVNLAEGGIFGNDVIIDLGSGAYLELSGGSMAMEATCTIQGAGDLIVSSGSHDLSFSIDAHITISGGSLVWPESRGSDQTITFNGGLLIEGSGSLVVLPFSTTIVVHNGVEINDEAMIQFPLIGIAAQASPFDRSDAPDTSPRGNFTSTGTMKWNGGTLKGKADFNAMLELLLDGNIKYIKSLAKLVNRGHCEWGNGDLVGSDNGDFQNFGSLQMMNGVSEFDSSSLYQGTELPIENGGDVFALEYHNWDMDAGSLSYSEYLSLRTAFVSRAPVGWSENDQS